MPRLSSLLLASVCVLAALRAAAAERINHEGRILGPQLAVTNATLFNTPESDAILASLQIFPVDSAWNEDITTRPLLLNSATMMAQITNDLATNRQNVRAFFEMNWVLVPDAQPHPIPTNMPIETWPSQTGGQTLDQWQRDAFTNGGDRHAIIVQPGTGGLWETWLTKKTNGNWIASNGAKFDTRSNALRPLTWTSGDAAGLAMFPGVVRYDECARGTVEHALRLVVKHSRAEFIYPATHYASSPFTTDTNTPAMGQRLRLKSSFTIPANWSREEKALLNALKKYGGIVADNGGFCSVSVAPDDRFTNNAFAHIGSMAVTNFEVIQTTSTNGGPRSAGRPGADAGPDQNISFGQTAALNGAVTWSNLPPVIQWKLYSGPGAVAFGDATNPATTATFSVPGSYTLMLSANDGVHAVAFDAVVIAVVPVINAGIASSGTNVLLTFAGTAAPPYVVEKNTNLAAAPWLPLQTNAGTNFSVPVVPAESAAFFRVRSP
ncbi:MAG: hypothetical protein HY301_14750 [Verrucomicrobia bacterium]|nr:hypothetical protein [Verrucomicrobiota bacterium]